MAFTATQWIFKASLVTSTTTATVGAYTVPAATTGQIIALTLANSATTNVIAYADVALYDGSTAYTLLKKAPLYPGGMLVAEGFQKHSLPTGGAVYVTPYATTGVTAVLTVIEVT